MFILVGAPQPLENRNLRFGLYWEVNSFCPESFRIPRRLRQLTAQEGRLDTATYVGDRLGWVGITNSNSSSATQ